MSKGSKKRSHTTHDWRDQSTGFPLGIFRRTIGLTSTTSTLIPPQPSLIMMVSSTVITLLVVIMVLLCQLSIMAILLLKSWPVVLLSVILINSIITIKVMHVLMRYMALWLAASRARRKAGQDKRTKSGVRVWWSNVKYRMVTMILSGFRWGG